MDSRFVIAFVVLFCSPALAGPKKSSTPEIVPGQYLVQIHQKPKTTLAQIGQNLNARVVEQIRPDVYLIERNKNEPVASALRKLQANSMVTLAEPNMIVRTSKMPNDAEYVKLWGLTNHGDADKDGLRGLKGVDIQAERAWEQINSAQSVVVAVIDTGIDFSHPDLAGNQWVNVPEAQGEAGVDDDQNGFIDDIHGFNFIGNNGNVQDDYGHGTHCAGTIGATGDNGIGVVGVAWNVRLMALKFLDAYGSGTIADAVKAIDYARLMKAQILNNSWGGVGTSEILKRAIADTQAAGQLFIAAAGNNGADNDTTAIQPAGLPFDNIISVAAVDNRGNLAEFSNFGAQTVHLVAPGVNIFSTTPGGYEMNSGTSMAAPHVTGVAALVLSQNASMTYGELKARILESARPLVLTQGRVKTAGIVDAYFAVSGEEPPKLDPNDPALFANQISYSASTPHPYPNGYSETFRITIPGAKRISVRFSKFSTESLYDKVYFETASGEKRGVWSGNRTGQYSPVVEGDTMILKVKADTTKRDEGFDIDLVAYE